MQKNKPDIGKTEILAGIEQWIVGRNGERDREILRMYMVDGITFARMQDRLENIGYELSIDRIKKIVRKRKEELFRHI